MAYLIQCTIVPDGGQQRLVQRAEHIAYMIDGLDRTVAGGPFLDEDGTVLGMFVLLGMESLEKAKRFIAEEPYSAAGLFADVWLIRTRIMTPEPELEFVEQELARQKDEDLQRSAVRN